MTDHELIQKHAISEVLEAYRRLEIIVGDLHQGGPDLQYDEINDAAQFLIVAASRLRPS